MFCGGSPVWKKHARLWKNTSVFSPIFHEKSTKNPPKNREKLHLPHKSIKHRSLEHPLSQKDDFWSILGSRMASILGLQIDKLGLIIATCCPQGSRRHPGTLRGRILTLPGDIFESPGGHFGTSWGLSGTILRGLGVFFDHLGVMLGTTWQQIAANSRNQEQTATETSNWQQIPATIGNWCQIPANSSKQRQTIAKTRTNRSQ